MNRKTEKILAWIGNGLSILYFLMVLLGVLLLNTNTKEFKKVFNEMSQAQGQTFSPDLLFMSYMIQIIILAVVIILAIIATLIMKNNRVLAGVLFIIAAVVSLFVTNLVAMVLWIIVAVKLFIKKDNNNNIKQGKTNGTNHTQQQWNPEQDLNKKKDDPYIY
jgi:glucan phosphoethanolaminetransferase (alkaline phosphatase superfamily)